MIEDKIISAALYLSPIIHIPAKTLAIVGLCSFAVIVFAIVVYGFWKLTKLTSPISERLGIKLRNGERLMLKEKIYVSALGVMGIGIVGYGLVQLVNILY